MQSSLVGTKTAEPDSAPVGLEPPLSLYVHFPWCVKKCPYCDFNSHPQRHILDQQRYIDALIRDLENDIRIYPGSRKLSSIFMGGGTPSLFAGTAIDCLLREIRLRLEFDETIEITLEANPGAVEHDDFAAYRTAGVNRLSLGVQSFNSTHLKNLGRIHSAKDARLSIQAAQDSGFSNINLDLMYGLPGQTTESAVHDLEAALEFSPTHLSLYQLTIEPNTLFHRYPPVLPEHDRIIEIQQVLLDRLRRHDYQQYEVSAYARSGMQCRHNLNYWQFGDYLGIGAGAHGKMSQGSEIIRYWKQKHPQRYLEAAGSTQGIGDCGAIADADVIFEFLMNALRLRGGFDVSLALARTGRDIDEMLILLDQAISRKLVIVDQSRIRCSEKGYLFLDEILQQILP